MERKKNLSSLATLETDALGQTLKVIGDQDLFALSQEKNIPFSTIILECMKKGIWPRRYLRNQTVHPPLNSKSPFLNPGWLWWGQWGLGGHVIEGLSPPGGRDPAHI